MCTVLRKHTLFMLDAMAAGVGCMLASIRNLVALKTRSHRVVAFLSEQIWRFAYEWFVLNHGWLIIVAYSSSLIFTVGSIVLKDAKRIRQWFLVAESLGLAYSILVGSILAPFLMSVTCSALSLSWCRRTIEIANYRR